jgi:TolA-binding protein
MRPSSGQSKGQHALASLTELARDSVRPPTSMEIEAGLQVLSARIAGERSRRTRLLRWSLVGATAAAAVVLGVGIFARSPAHLPAAAAPALAYQIEGGSLVAGGYLRESGRGAIKLFFEEGSEFVLMPGTRSRLRTVDASGARIAIEHGTASFLITPRSDHKWLVDIGPFLVTVRGTVFTVSWDAGTERFELRLQHGRVTVSGPISGGDISLQAGQRLVVDLPKAETRITEQNPGEDWGGTATAAPAAYPPGERPSALPEKPAKTSPAAAPSPRLDGDHRWSEALAAGHLDKIIAEAESAGVKATLEKAASDDLFALADAARYRRRMDLAREALLAVQKRFPGSSRALDAAFLLGRVEEANERGLVKAVEWYDAYLRRAPRGTYAAEALGRKMTLTNKLEGAGQARPLAEEYLRRFPNGSYAGSARALRRAP